MAITGPIPIPENGMDAFLDALQKGQDYRYKGAQTKREEALANLPFGGANVPGPAGQVMGLEMVRMMYGENSPQYKQAKQSFDLNQQSVGSRVNYQNVLAGSVPMRYTTPEGRGLIEQSNVGQGASPTGTPEGQPAIPGGLPYKSPYGSPEEAAGQYGLERLKKNIPSPILQKNLYATNIDKTLENLNVDDLTSYGGLKGAGELLKDKGQAALGKDIPRYQKYQEALTASDTLAKQVRQFYGDSITPSVQEGLKYLTNPVNWMNNPKIAKAKFDKFKNILQQETQTYRQAFKGTDVYTGKNANKVASKFDKWAQEAIDQGADPEAVKNRLAQLQGGS